MVQATVLLFLSGEHPENRSVRRRLLSDFRSSFVCKVLTMAAENEFITWLAVNHHSCHNYGVITLIIEPNAVTKLIMTGR